MVHYKKNLFSILTLLIVILGFQYLDAQTLTVENDKDGSRLMLDGQEFMVKGMNWDYFPIGKTYTYSLWSQSDEFIKNALDREMPLLKSMGINVIRQYAGIPPRWVQYIYENYGIYTVINHPLGRYGVTIDGVYYPSTDYSNEQTRSTLKKEMESLVDQFQNTPGMLFWLLGNENNYGLTWKSAETEALPEGERQPAKARYLYSLFSEVTDLIKSKDSRPVCMANGDVQYIDIISEELKNLDIFGSNVYRGISARDMFDVVKEKLGIPLIFTEFGSDAFNARTMTEDQAMQAKYLIGQWQEIYEQSYGKGRVGNASGGFTFQFSDGWWKYKQDENLDIHDVNASWPNGGYQEDFEEGENNMNEEWWGICAKGYPDSYGYYDLYPRAAYYALKKAYLLDPFAQDTDLKKIRDHFATITPTESAIEARGNTAALKADISSKVRVKRLQLQFETISTGGDKISTPESSEMASDGYPSFQGFDHLESFYTEFEAKPSENVLGTLTLNYIGHVPVNPIDEIFYENRGRIKTFETYYGEESIEGLERLKVYDASVSWQDRWFNLEGFYRTGHYHWGYEGDFFGLYREANYGPNIDIYNGNAPLGMEITGKKKFAGLKLAIGPELWWGANPAVFLKYQRQVGKINATAIYQEDLDEQNNDVVTSSAIPLPSTRKATLHLETQKGPFNIEVGGIWSGENKVGEPFLFMKENDDVVYLDYIEDKDAFGGKIKLTYQKGKINWYMQGAIMGLVADGGPTETQTFSGYWLKDSGKGNQRNIITGFSTRFGNFEFSPNFLWQKPIVGPMPSDAPQPGVPRNILDDPFAVRENREMTAGELVFTYDPTPATWMYHWNSDEIEDAYFAFTLGLIFKHMPTTMDAALYFDSSAGNPVYAFPGATPPRDIFESRLRIVSKPKPGIGLVANVFAGEGEPNGDDPRKISRYGADVKLITGSTRIQTIFKYNDWGPYDYHKDHNLTFPLQLIFDISTSSGIPGWFDLPETKLGVKVTYRTLDENSPRYAPETDPGPIGVDDPVYLADDYGFGNEWEIRTYLHFNVSL